MRNWKALFTTKTHQTSIMQFQVWRAREQDLNDQETDQDPTGKPNSWEESKDDSTLRIEFSPNRMSFETANDSRTFERTGKNDIWETMEARLFFSWFFFATALVFPRLSSFILSRKTTKYLFGWSFRVDWCYGFCCIRVSCIPDQTSHLMIRIFVKTPRLEVPRIEVTNEISERNLRLTTLSGCVVSHNSFRLNWGSYSWTFCVKLHSWNPRL